MNGCGHDKLVVSECGHEYHGMNSKMTLLGSSWLHKMDGGNLLEGKFFKAMAATAIM